MDPYRYMTFASRKVMQAWAERERPGPEPRSKAIREPDPPHRYRNCSPTSPGCCQSSSPDTSHNRQRDGR